jgi:predicted lipoprotein
MKLDLVAPIGDFNKRKIHKVFGLSEKRMLEIKREMGDIVKTLHTEDGISNTSFLYEVLSQLEGRNREELAFMAYIIGGFSVKMEDPLHDILSNPVVNTFK